MILLFSSLSAFAKAPDQSLLEAHRHNYQLPYAYSGVTDTERLPYEAQFQISVKRKIIERYGVSLYMAYTQRSFWQIYNLTASRPFRETNHMPELFIQSPSLKQTPLKARLGVLHQSNGAKEPISRSWDRQFIELVYTGEHLHIDHRFWRRRPEPAKAYPSDPSGDENPDIIDFYGLQQAEVSALYGSYELSVMERFNLRTQKGAVQVQCIGPIGSSGLSWDLIVFHGYGESLIDYNRSLTKVGLGFLFAR